MYFPSEYRKNFDKILNKMPIMKSYLSNSDKLSSIRDNLDEEISDDIEDDVFIRDGKMSKNYEDKRLKRPLMPPKKLRFSNQKHNHNNNNFNSVPILLKKKTKCWKCCEPLCYGFIAIVVLLALIFLAAILLTMFPIPLQKIKIWLKKDQSFSSSSSNLIRSSSANGYDASGKNSENVPCTQISVHKVWSKAISRINSETPLRKVDLNNDGVEDVVIGYGIDEFFQYSDMQAPRCQFGKSDEAIICEGGLLAFNGATGETIWQRWTTFTIFSVYCAVDLTKDGQIDCIAAGRGGLMVAIDGKNGNLLWQFSENLDMDILTNQYFIDLYTVNPVRDLDGDLISDIVTVHVEETPAAKSGHIKLISGATGKIIRTIPTPYREEVFVPLQFITQPDGTESLLIITGGQNTPGGLYTIRLNTLMQATSQSDFTTIFHSDSSGFMVPAVLTDLTGDGIEDIIISSFNSTVYAFDGKTFKMLWSYIFPTSESVSSIVPGYFDADNITDFMVKYNTGPGFPVYYYSQTTILNGLNGKPLLDKMMTDSGGPNSLLGGISMSQDTGGDIFLHWQTECRGKAESKDAYRFLPDSDIIQQSRADTCLLRFNTSTVLKLYAISRHLEPPGKLIFSTDDLILQLNQTFQKPTTTITTKSNSNAITPLKHPKMRLKTTENNKEKIKSGAGEVSNQNNNVEKKRIDNNNNINNKNGMGIGNANNINNKETIGREQKLDNRKMISIEENNDIVKEEKPYIYLPYDDRDRAYKNLQYAMNEQKEQQQQQQQQSEYDMMYDDNEQQSMGRNRNPNRNHGIRRSSSNTNNNNNDNKNNNTTKKGNPETLWDLEIEKENAESLNDNNYDYQSRQRRTDDENLFNLNQNLLSSISSTGILVNSLLKTDDTMDYIFVLNVRESETLPPLYLAEDVECVENRMRNYPNYVNNNLLSIEKEFLSECLQKRLPNISQPTQQQFETQIVITRIKITCACESLNKNEICSKFNKIENQKWTGFMGNNGNGIFPK